ncbi:MAG: GspH/FimT family pseudopilin, partial [Syntrophales bacterium]|nr:GspH/FimT family pseudopilin [Syntrophales bacterium]
FSLVELIITMALLGMMAAIAIPAFFSYNQNVNLKSAVREITSDIYLAREKSVSENRKHRISFSLADNNYVVEQGTSSGSPYTGIETKVMASFGSGVRLTAVSFGGNPAIVFQTRGTTEAGTVSLQNDRGSAATITTTLTGRTYVQYALQ